MRCRNRTRRHGGFTLVELLVVIGVIAVLIAILLPALGRAREMGKQTQCLNNVRQLGTANLMYVNEFKGWCLPGYWGWSQSSGGWPTSTEPTPAADGPRRYWFQVWSLAANLSVKTRTPEAGRFPAGLMCPNATMSFERGNRDGYTLHNSYSANYSQYLGMNARIAPTYWNAWRLQEVRAPSEKIQFCDGTSEGVNVGSTPNGTIRYFDAYYGGEKHEPPDKGGAVAYRHSRGACVTFYDGHAGWAHVSNLAYNPADPNTTVNRRQWQPKVK